VSTASSSDLIQTMGRKYVNSKFVTNTPKVLANCSPGLERSDNPGYQFKYTANPERVRRLANPFQG